MEERKSNKGLIAVIIIMFLIIIGLVMYIVLNNNTNKEVEQKEEVETSENTKVEEETVEKNEKEEIKLSDLYGTYSWQEDYTTDSGANLTRKIKLTLNADGSALYEASSGMDAESTKGVFTFENGYITYTRQYYNYDNSSTEYTGGQKTESFKVVDKNTLTATVSNFSNINVTLTK